ncbi:MAG TPA: aldo/keto reductase, partial [Rhizomicrobium sp.]|nr:aldo/keto reductase [Rhizomicrobium sp.]
PFVTTVIIGAKTTDQLDDNLAAVKVHLSADEMKSFDEASALPMEYPGWMLARQSAERIPQAK